MEDVLWQHAWQSFMLGVLMQLWGLSRCTPAAGMLEAAGTSMPRHLEEVIKPTYAVQVALQTTAIKLHWI